MDDLVEGIHQVDDLLAGETEDVLHSLVFQASGDKLRYVHMITSKHRLESLSYQ